LDYLSAIVIGLVGSLHCAGMCGPIAVALPLSTDSWTGKVAGSLLYNIGRTITYGFLGLVFGLAGMGLSLGGLQQWASIGLGIIMILSVVVPRIARIGSAAEKAVDRVSRWMTGAFSRLFRIRSHGSLFTIGLLNGFLPCGLVYVALAGAVVAGNARDGALYMVLFGLGTIPMMLGISIAGNILSSAFRKKISRVVPYFIVLLGIIFILRGMNLGIPYVSPKLKHSTEMTTLDCCKKN